MGKQRSAKSDRKLSDDEATLFERAMSDVARVPPGSQPKLIPVAKGKRRQGSATSSNLATVLQEPAVTEAPPASLPYKKRSPLLQPAQPDRRGSASGLDRRTGQRLVRGKFSIDDRIDLHGMTQNEALRALTGFLKQAAGNDMRCVLVITGKGSVRENQDDFMPDQSVGVLRRSFPRWLSQPGISNLVVAYHNAKPKDGGEGAFYVLLRRRRV
ncbi:MAG: Smr/MutS family protein [Proteobacteria bacterium]|nr:Smr/MutS family protein [Pseudomonadota bacterium]